MRDHQHLTTTETTMPQVVALLNEEEHKALARRAKLNRRSIGNQLIAEAFLNEGREVPEYLNKKTKPRTKVKA